GILQGARYGARFLFVLQHARRSRPPRDGARYRGGDARLMDLKDLYRDVIVDHNRNPRNFRSMPDADRKAEGFNPLCGDRLTLYVRLEGDTIRDVSFEGSGCAISVASASLMPERGHGRAV